MRTRQLFLGIFALALLLPLLLLACGGSDEPTEEPTDRPSSARATPEPTDLPDSEQATSQPAGRTSTDQTTAAPTTRPTTQPDTPAATETSGRAATPAATETSGRAATPAATETSGRAATPTGPTVTEAPQPTVAASATSTPVAQEEPLGEWILNPENPLLLAAMTGDPADVAKLLPNYQIQNMVTTITSRANSEETNTAGERNIYENVSPLHLAAGFNKDPEMITLLLDAGAAIEGDRRSFTLFYTPLHFAALYNEEPAVTAALLEGGADANAKTTAKDVHNVLTRRVLELAAQYNSNPKVIELLLDWGAESFRSPLYLVAGYNPHLDVLRALLDRFAVGENRQGVLNEVMYAAAELNPNLEVIKLVLDLGADPADPGYGPLAIRAAISDNPNPEILAALIAGGADTTLLSNHHTLLLPALGRENTAFAELLLDAGVDPNLGNKDGRTPMYWAQTGEMVELLVARGADPDFKPEGRVMTPLADTVQWLSNSPENSRTKVTALLEAGADPNAILWNKTPMLLSAAQYDQAWIAQELLKYGADTTTKDREGNTALHIAAKKSYAAIAENLLEAGADRKAVNDQGSTPCHLARGSGSFTGTPLLVQLCRP